jgi:hypothetical protein
MHEPDSTGPPQKRASVQMEIRHFKLPPVESALVVGVRSPIGPNAMERALQEMMPHKYVRVDVDNERIQTIFLQATHLRRIPKEKLVPLLVTNCEEMIDDTEMLHVTLDVLVAATEEVGL